MSWFFEKGEVMQMKNAGIGCILMVVVGLGSMSLAAPTQYSGSLNGTSGGILGTNPGGNPWLSVNTSFSWIVTDYQDGTYGYEYTLKVPAKQISHFIIEVSPTFEYSNIVQYGSGSFNLDNYGPGTQGNSNPSIPGLMRGIKTGSGNLSYTLQFISDRMPVWGDFYAKSGNAGGFVAIWNAGFTAADTDPTAGFSNGSFENHILVPDSTTPPTIPAPAAMVLGSMGMGLVGYLRRRNTL